MNGERDALAAHYVVGLAEPEEAKRAEQLMAKDAGFRRTVQMWRNHLAPLDDTAAETKPSPQLWDRIDASVGHQTRLRRAAEDSSRPSFSNSFTLLWQSLNFWRIGGMSAAAAALVLAVALGGQLRRVAPGPVLVAVLIKENATAPAAIVNAFADGTVELVPLENIDVPEGRALEIWTLWDRQRGPVSVGLMDRPRSIRLKLDNLPKNAGQLFEITLEPKTGSPTGRPTGPILMKGLTTTAL